MKRLNLNISKDGSEYVISFDMLDSHDDNWVTISTLVSKEISPKQFEQLVHLITAYTTDCKYINFDCTIGGQYNPSPFD